MTTQQKYEEYCKQKFANDELPLPLTDWLELEDWLDKPVEPFDPTLLTAFKRGSFPSNPRPFLRALDAGVAAHGSEWIKSPEARALLWVVMAQTHGQLAIVDSLKEHEELSKFF